MQALGVVLSIVAAASVGVAVFLHHDGYEHDFADKLAEALGIASTGAAVVVLGSQIDDRNYDCALHQQHCPDYSHGTLHLIWDALWPWIKLPYTDLWMVVLCGFLGWLLAKLTPRKPAGGSAS